MHGRLLQESPNLRSTGLSRRLAQKLTVSFRKSEGQCRSLHAASAEFQRRLPER